MSGFTPGPWEVAEPDHNGQPVVRAGHYEVATCWHHCVRSIEREAHANARLIAAAPDLLNVANWAEQYVESDPAAYEALAIIRAAIAKAEGK